MLPELISLCMMVSSLFIETGTASSLDACPFHYATRAFFITSQKYPDDTKSGQTAVCSAPDCDPYARYQRLDGACASSDPIRRPLTGARNQCNRRLTAASYVDGVSKPLKSVDVVTLFNAIQNNLSPNDFDPEGEFNGVFTFISQFRAHDMSKTALSGFYDSEGKFDCCEQKNHHLPQCSMRVDVTNATKYKATPVKCMSFIRAAPCPCTTDKARASMNAETAYIDLSHVYIDGSNRDPRRRWRLATTESILSGPLPHVDPNPPICFGRECFKGEARMNQQHGISLFNIVFERLHNQMADVLRREKPFWNDDIIFEEARRLNIARWQYIVCNEIMGYQMNSDLLREYKIHIDQLMSGTAADPKVEAVTFVESVQTAFREHGLVPNQLGNDPKFFWLNSSVYFDRNDFVSQNAITQMNTPGKAFFPFADSVAHNFFQHPKAEIGLSMFLINVQRSRDTGVPTFKHLVKWAYNRTINSFDDIVELNAFRSTDIELLRKLYNDDITRVDAYVATHLELPYGGGIPGYIVQKIRAHQHHGQVYGDRYFFSHTKMFSKEQRQAIADSSSLSQIFCEALQLREVSRTPLIYRRNPEMVKCSDFKHLNYSMMIK